MASWPLTLAPVAYESTNFQQMQLVSGLMGLAGGKGAWNVVQNMADGGIDENIFSMCLQPGTGSKSNGTFTVSCFCIRAVHELRSLAD